MTHLASVRREPSVNNENYLKRKKKKMEKERFKSPMRDISVVVVVVVECEVCGVYLLVTHKVSC